MACGDGIKTRPVLAATTVSVDGPAVAVNDAEGWTLHLRKEGGGTAAFRVWGRTSAAGGWVRIDGALSLGAVVSPGLFVNPASTMPLQAIRVDVTAITGGSASAELVAL
jgi:hypothetical protein